MNAEAPGRHGHPLIRALEECAAVDDAHVAAASDFARRNRLPLDRALVQAGALDEERVLRVAADVLGWPFAPSLSDEPLDEEFPRRIPIDFARRNQCIGLRAEVGLRLAVCTALEPELVDAVAAAMDSPVRAVLVPCAEIAEAITRSYQEGAEITWDGADRPGEGELSGLTDAAGSRQDLLAAVESAPVVQLVNKLLFEALRARASDMHIQPADQGFVVRYRVDGVLHTIATYRASVLAPVVSRIKVMARMDITEKRLPQDGRTTVRLGNKHIDLRISTVPSNYGERVVVRLLDRSAGVFGLEELGMSPEHLAVMDQIVRREHGMFFCTGPTGSGKTTTLYAALQRIDSSERNVITLEDPIEYHLPGITQLPVTGKKGMSFASGLRSILRQDPDVIMVGEVRDAETARMAVRASQTGHLVLSTLHTNDSPGAVARLIDLEAEPFLLASSLSAVVAQRLVRRVCPRCAEPCRPKAHELRALGVDTADGDYRRGSGCEECLGTGFRGRIGLFEMLVVDEHIRQLILSRADAMTIREAAEEAGLVSLRQDGGRKAACGMTTPGEVIRATGSEVHA